MVHYPMGESVQKGHLMILENVHDIALSDERL